MEAIDDTIDSWTPLGLHPRTRRPLHCLVCVENVTVRPNAAVLAHPATIDIVHSASHKGSIIAEQERNDLGDLLWLGLTFHRRHLKAAPDVLWILPS